MGREMVVLWDVDGILVVCIAIMVGFIIFLLTLL